MSGAQRAEDGTPQSVCVSFVHLISISVLSSDSKELCGARCARCGPNVRDLCLLTALCFPDPIRGSSPWRPHFATSTPLSAPRSVCVAMHATTLKATGSSGCYQKTQDSPVKSVSNFAADLPALSCSKQKSCQPPCARIGILRTFYFLLYGILVLYRGPFDGSIYEWSRFPSNSQCDGKSEALTRSRWQLTGDAVMH